MRKRIHSVLHLMHNKGRIDATALAAGLVQLENFHFYHPERSAADLAPANPESFEQVQSTRVSASEHSAALPYQ